MHYYSFNVSNYRKKTGHLTLVEHAIYRSLIDTYYLQESPLTLDQDKLMRSHSVRTPDEKEAFNNVISDFFVKTNDGYTHDSCDEQLEIIYKKSEKARNSAKSRWGKKTNNDAKPMRTHSERNANACNLDANACKNDATGMLPINLLPNNLIPTKDIKDLSAKPDPVQPIFDYWVLTMGKKAGQVKLTPKRKKSIQGRLKEGYTPDQIKTAILNCRQDPWSMGANDRQTAFNDIELICRNGEKLESFIEKIQGVNGNAEIRHGRNTAPIGRKPTPAERVAIAHEKRYGRESSSETPDAHSVVSIQ